MDGADGDHIDDCFALDLRRSTFRGLELSSSLGPMTGIVVTLTLEGDDSARSGLFLDLLFELSESDMLDSEDKL